MDDRAFPEISPNPIEASLIVQAGLKKKWRMKVNADKSLAQFTGVSNINDKDLYFYIVSFLIYTQYKNSNCLNFKYLVLI